MTYCLAIRTRDGLVALADGRVTSGSQMGVTRKLAMLGDGEGRFFIMTSGLRSLRDKVMTYLTRDGYFAEGGFQSILGVVMAFGRELREVAKEDREAIEASQLQFNLHALIGGKLAEDKRPTVYLVYPEGNWIEVDERQPYLSIGSTAYGKPILDRALKFDTPMRHALKLAYLSFDSARFSSTDVGYPIDLVTYAEADGLWRQSQLDYDQLVEQRQWWNQRITQLAEGLPDDPWVDDVLPAGQLRLTVVGDDGA